MTTALRAAATAPSPRPTRRRAAERRTGVAEVLAHALRALSAPATPAALLDAMQISLRCVLPIRRLDLQDGYLRAIDAPHLDTKYLRLDLTLPPAFRPMALIVEWDPATQPDDWDLHFLHTLRELVSLIVVMEPTPRGSMSAPGALRSRFPFEAPTIVGSSPAIKQVVAETLRLARTPYTVLLLGETGTGKELFARLIHAKSHRKQEPFVAVNCAAIVDTLAEAELFGIEDGTATGVRGRRGKFEEAQGGTLFLDEVGDLSKAAQAKLLRVLQDWTIERVGSHASRRLDVRVVAASNQSLADLVVRRRFRPDLFHRLAGLEVVLPPLRERGDDVLDIARHLLQTLARERTLRLTPSAEDALRSYDWPGNVRELEHVIQRLLVFVEGDNIDVTHLPPPVTQRYRDVVMGPALRGETLRVWMSRLCRYYVEHTGSKSKACRQLGITFHTLQHHLRRPPHALRARS